MTIFMDLMHAIVVFLETYGTLNVSGVVALFAVFALSGLIPIPRTALCLAGGAVYGMAALFVIIPATTLCSLVGFLLARYLFSAPLYRYAERRKILRAVLAAVDAEGWKIVALMRFWSAMPTFMQNYLFGLTRIAIWPYILATFVFSIPQLCVYVYLGAIGRAALLGEGKSSLSVALSTLAIACMLTIASIIVSRVRTMLSLDQASSSKPHSDE